ncbi:Uncharacterized protein CTYZ_00003936 [Cryptosporidium tyzzeri]|nr:Uncharacterized protein CTYZ_00003936 [Cryptosporidium tyzzeri]
MASIEVYREAIRTVIEYVSTKYGPEEETVINMILESKGIPGIFRGQSIHPLENMMIGRGHSIMLENSMDHDSRIPPIDTNNNNNNNNNTGLNIISSMIQPAMQQQIQPIIHHPIIQHPISPEIQTLIQSPMIAQSLIQQQQINSLTAGTVASSSITINSNTNTNSASVSSPNYLEQPSTTVVTTTNNFQYENSGDEKSISSVVAVANTGCNSPPLTSSSYSFSSSSAEPLILSNSNTTTTTTTTITTTSSSSFTKNNDNSINSIKITNNEKDINNSNIMNTHNNMTESTTYNSELSKQLKENSNFNIETQVSDEKTNEQINNINKFDEKENDIEDISEKIRTMLRMATNVNELNQAIKMAYSVGLTYEAGLGERKLKKLLC